MVRQLVVEPLNQLGAVAQRIDQNDLSIPVTINGAQEMQTLGENFERMRLRLQNTQAELITWAGTLEQRVDQRTQELAALYSVSHEITSQLDLNLVLRSVTQKTKELLGAEVVFLCLLDDKGHVMNLCATTGPEPAIHAVSSPVYNPTVHHVLSGEHALRCSEHGCQGYCEIISAPYRISHLAAPLRIGRQIIGALCVGSSKPDSFKEYALDVLTKLASVAAVALQNARLYEQAERAATLEERQRIATEMHDGLAQTLSYLHMAVEQTALQVEAGQSEKALTTLARVQAAFLQAVEDTRRAIASLQEPSPLRLSLQEQISELAHTLSGDGLQVHWSTQFQTPLIMPQQESEQVLRVIREALLNAKRHAQASQINIRLDYFDQTMRVNVEDDGIGFDPGSVHSDNGKHFGLNIMQARASRLKGQVNIHSAPGAGTQVTLSWPLKLEN
jgi:two-component system nitrate/nitrite sensor histidine kinase NarX